MFCLMAQILYKILMQILMMVLVMVLVMVLCMRHHFTMCTDFGMQMEATQRNHQERHAGECKDVFGR